VSKNLLDMGLGKDIRLDVEQVIGVDYFIELSSISTVELPD
jgi:hypothetical protein